MALVVKNLASKSLNGGTNQGLYTCSAGKSAFVSSIRLVNSGSTVATTTVKLLAVADAHDYYVTKPSLQISTSTSHVMDDPLTLGPGDILRIDVAGGNPVQCVVNGVERSL